MPYPNIESAKKANFPTVLDGVNLSIEQINKLAEIYDSIKQKGTVDEPMAVAVKTWKQVYKKEGDAWVTIQATDFDEEMLVLSPKAFEISEARETTQILPLGEWKGHKKGPFKVTTEVIKKMIENFKKGERDRVIDYEHATLSGQEAPAAGWIKRLIDGGSKGLMAVTEWNDKAKEYIAKKEYRFLSPVFTMNRKDKVTGEDTGPYLHSVALTNDPFLDQIMPLVNKSFINLSPIDIPIGLINYLEEDTKMKDLLIKLLKLKDTATDEEITKALNDLIAAKTPEDVHELLGIDKDTSIDSVKATMTLCTDTLKELGLEADADIEKVKEKVVALKDEGKKENDKDFVPLKDFKDLQSQIAAKDKEVEDIKNVLALNEQTRLKKWAVDDEKRMTPAQWEAWGETMALKDPEGFEKIVNTIEPQINTEKISDGVTLKDQQKEAQAEKLIKEEMKLSDSSYEEAALVVSKEHPELFKDAFE